MEARKITIVSTKTQKKSVIMSSAETLSQLKADLDAAGIDYEDMTFFEGTSKTELKSNESVLPKNVPYTNRTTGETKITNELVFMLTNTNKKIKSGAASRASLYAEIKGLGLQDECKAMFGKNYTNCSTKDLIILVESHAPMAQEPTVIELPAEELPEGEYFADFSAREAIETLVNILVYNDCITSKEGKQVIRSYKKDVDDSPYSDDEVDKMFEDFCL